MHADVTLIDENRDPMPDDILVMIEGTPFWVQTIPRDERDYLDYDQTHVVVSYLSEISPVSPSAYLTLVTLSPLGDICEFFINSGRRDATFVQI